MRGFLGAGCLALACVGLVGCGGGSGPVAVTSAATQDTAPTTGTVATSSSSAPAQQYVVGQCYRDDGWQLTPCTQPHEKEITAVVDTTRYADDMVMRGVLRTWTCNNVLPGYVGSSTAGFSRIFATSVPTADVPDPDKQIVCAASVDKPDDSGAQTVSYTVRNRIKDKGYVPYRLCTKERPSTTTSDSLTFISCNEPHRAETTGGLVLGSPDGRYPGLKTAQSDATNECLPLDRTYLGVEHTTQVTAYSSITGKTGWERGTTLVGCFIESTKGTFVKPLKGMKHQPLSKFR